MYLSQVCLLYPRVPLMPGGSPAKNRSGDSLEFRSWCAASGGLKKFCYWGGFSKGILFYSRYLSGSRYQIRVHRVIIRYCILKFPYHVLENSLFPGLASGSTAPFIPQLFFKNRYDILYILSRAAYVCTCGSCLLPRCSEFAVIFYSVGAIGKISFIPQIVRVGSFKNIEIRFCPFPDNHPSLHVVTCGTPAILGCFQSFFQCFCGFA